MEQMININFPSDLAVSLKMDEKEFTEEIKKAAMLKLYEQGKVSSGVAAKVLGISRLDFLDLLSKHNISFLESDEEKIKEDSNNA
jgi:predicted HTH domain antitoxin